MKGILAPAVRKGSFERKLHSKLKPLEEEA